MKISSLIVGLLVVLVVLVVLSAGYGHLKHEEAARADELLEKLRRIRPHANQAEVEKIFGPPDGIYAAGELPPWLKNSAIGGVTDGIVLVYATKRYWKDLMIHLVPESGVQFVTVTGG